MKIKDLTETIFYTILDMYLERAYSDKNIRKLRKNTELFTGNKLDFNDFIKQLRNIIPQYGCGEVQLRLGCEDYNGILLVFSYIPEQNDKVTITVDPHLNSQIETEDKNLYDIVEKLADEINNSLKLHPKLSLN